MVPLILHGETRDQGHQSYVASGYLNDSIFPPREKFSSIHSCYIWQPSQNFLHVDIRFLMADPETGSGDSLLLGLPATMADTVTGRASSLLTRQARWGDGE